MRGIKVVCFDIGGTLIDTGPSFVGAIQQLVGRTLLRSEWSSLFNLTRGSAHEDLSRISSVFDIELKDVFRLYEEHRQRPPRLYDEVMSTLQRLLHLRCVALSNTARWMASDKLLGARPFISDVFYSYAIGHAKPDPEAFRFVQRAVNTPADNILMVGDSLTYDYDGAIAAGWRAVLVDRRGRYPQALHSIKRLDTLVDMLGQRDGRTEKYA